eukprot:tig00000449_g936.t1
MTSALSGRSTALPGASRAPGSSAANLGRGSLERLSDLWAQLTRSACELERGGASRRSYACPTNAAPLTLYAFEGSIIDISLPPSRFGCASLFSDAIGWRARPRPAKGGGSRTGDLETEPRRPELETCSQFTTTAPTACLAGAAGMAKMTTMAPRRLATLAARCWVRRGSATGAVAHTGRGAADRDHQNEPGLCCAKAHRKDYVDVKKTCYPLGAR